MRAWTGYVGWSGNPQRSPFLCADGSLACCSPQLRELQLRSQTSRFTQSPARATDRSGMDDAMTRSVLINL
jgi:hypothetical protein